MCRGDAPSDRFVHCAKGDIRHKGNWREDVDGTHVCAADHVELWPGFTKTFGDFDRTARLSFTPCQFAPEDTLLLHLELWGRVYEKHQRACRAGGPSNTRRGRTEAEPTHGTWQRSVFEHHFRIPPSKHLFRSVPVIHASSDPYDASGVILSARV